MTPLTGANDHRDLAPQETRGTDLDPPFILAAVLGLVLTSALGWIYFVRDDEVAREIMLTRPVPQQLRPKREQPFLFA